MELDPGLRAGLAAQPGMLAMLATHEQTHPIRRGLFVRERLLCQELPPPPASVQAEIPALDAVTTTRERFSMHATADCAGCHQLIDPLGFAFEGFDAMGRARDEDNGHPIDATGWVCADGSCEEPTPIDGAVELADYLGASDQTRDCITREWVRFAMHAPVEAIDTCEVQRLSAELAETDDLRELLISIAMSDTFGRVGAAEGE